MHDTSITTYDAIYVWKYINRYVNTLRRKIRSFYIVLSSPGRCHPKLHSCKMSVIVLEAISQQDIQLQSTSETPVSSLPSSIQASPYSDLRLDLCLLSPVHAEVAKRLQNLSPRGYNYHLDKPYSEAFNFQECLTDFQHDTVQLYVVVFRSTIHSEAVSTDLFKRLHKQDHESYIEANTQVGGLLKYWFGVIDENRRNLATCVWVDRDHARQASGLEQHRKAVEIVRQGVYEDWTIERYVLRLARGEVQFERL